MAGVNAEYAAKWPNITIKKEPPADQWEGIEQSRAFLAKGGGVALDRS
jgi:hypothetical protein